MLSKKIYKLNARIFSPEPLEAMILGNYVIPGPDPRLYGEDPDSPGSSSEVKQRKVRLDRFNSIADILDDSIFRAAAVAQITRKDGKNDVNKSAEEGLALLNDLNDLDTYETSAHDKRIQNNNAVMKPTKAWIDDAKKILEWINSSVDDPLYSVALAAVE